MKKYSTLLLFSLLCLIACKTAVKAYDKGDYESAIELAIKKLQKDPRDGETKSLLKNAYRFALNKHEDNIRILSNRTNESRYEQIFNEYRQLQNYYTKINSLPTLTSFIKPTDFSNELQTYKDKIADVYVQKGAAFMQDGDKEDFRKAYHSFKTALNFRPDDAAIDKKMTEAYELAVVNIVVLPVDQFYNTGYTSGNSYRLTNFGADVVRNLRQQANNEFVKFYSQRDARSSDIVPDEILEMRLGRMEIGRPYDELKTHTASKDVVIKETVYKPDSVIKQYAKVLAEITVTRRTLVSNGELYLTSRDTKGRVLWTDIFRGEHRWQVEFASYRGDERALSENDRSVLNKRFDVKAPGEDDIIDGIVRQIENEMNRRVRDHYNRNY